MVNFNGLIQPFVSELRDPSSEKLVNPDGTINEKAIKAALNLGFPDITPRTMSDRDKAYLEKGKLKFDKMPDALFDYCAEDQSQTFGGMIKTWFEKEHTAWKEEFEILHSKACNTVLSFLRDQLYSEKSCTYGKGIHRACARNRSGQQGEQTALEQGANQIEQCKNQREAA